MTEFERSNLDRILHLIGKHLADNLQVFNYSNHTWEVAFVAPVGDNRIRFEGQSEVMDIAAEQALTRYAEALNEFRDRRAGQLIEIDDLIGEVTA
jgi:hypothetical protein